MKEKYRTNLKSYRITTKKNTNIFISAKNMEEALHRCGFTCSDVQRKKVKIVKI